jgi:hypothetical protein
VSGRSECRRRRRRGRPASRVAAAAAAMVVIGAGAVGAAADTRRFGDIAVACQDGSARSTVTLPPVTVAAPAEVPENGAALVQVQPTLPPLADAGLTVTAAQVTIGIPEDDADVDLTFAGGNLPALTWDARSGVRIVISFGAPAPLLYTDARLPEITVINTFDPRSSGRTVDWRVFAALSVSVQGAGATRTVACTPLAPAAVLNRTRITPPTAPHESPILARDAVIRVGAVAGEKPIDGAAPDPAAPTGVSASPAAGGRDPGSAGAEPASPGAADAAAGATDGAGTADAAAGPAAAVSETPGAAEGAAAAGPPTPPTGGIPWVLIASPVGVGVAAGAIGLVAHRRRRGRPQPGF